MAELVLPGFEKFVVPAGFKRCNRCDEVKPLEEFHFRSDQWHPDGTRRRKQPCKDCYNDDIMKHRRAHPEVQQAWNVTNRGKLRKQARTNYALRRTNFRGWVTSNLMTRRQQCRKAGIEFTITVEQIEALYEAQQGLCALTARELKWGSDTNRGSDTLSVDRIDAAGPYVIENVRLVTLWANVARQRLSDTEFVEMCRAVVSGAALPRV